MKTAPPAARRTTRVLLGCAVSLGHAISLPHPPLPPPQRWGRRSPAHPQEWARSSAVSREGAGSDPALWEFLTLTTRLARAQHQRCRTASALGWDVYTLPERGVRGMVWTLGWHRALLNVPLGAGHDGVARSCSLSPARLGQRLPWTRQQSPGEGGDEDGASQVATTCGSSSGGGLFFFSRGFISCRATLQGDPQTY